MLVPASDDANRDEELARQKKDPTSFGTDEVSGYPKDWNPNGGLKVIAREEATGKKAKKA